MSNILVLNSSLSGEASVSRLLVADAVTELTQRDPNATLVFRDLAANPIPHLHPDGYAGVRAQATTPAELAARALSDELIAELFAADTIVIGAPMYNFSIPSTLRTWFDHVLRPGVTFGYSEAGPKGLVTGKRVIIVESRGGLYSEGPAQALDVQEPYLRQLFGFMGVTDVTFVRAEKIAFGPDARDQALTESRAVLAKLGA
ncbi:FMN-dependent NADH-azoreductase [Phenylobacterium sp.]|uniref:FMN-dependent NADH-azoreductase n=1 Tax=Phenylobacterium sp. TaxID=1871053 RepID=UPI00286A3A02|nr:FMN-dependent NADH-azoreductase [Phenylobacterium sp.]